MFDWARASQKVECRVPRLFGHRPKLLVRVSPASWDDENSTMGWDSVIEYTRGGYREYPGLEAPVIERKPVCGGSCYREVARVLGGSSYRGAARVLVFLAGGLISARLVHNYSPPPACLGGGEGTLFV